MLDFEQEIRRLCAQSEHDAATSLVLRQLGPRILRYLSLRARDDALACDAFSDFAEDLWRAMPRFAGRSSVRLYAFTIARNALGQLLRERKRARERPAEWHSSSLNELAAQVRTRTLAYLKTETKERLAELRQRLSAEEQALLVLRVNEQLSWDEIARIELDEPTDLEIKREAARLRKRFQLVRDRLRDMARAEGLLKDEDSS